MPWRRVSIRPVSSSYFEFVEVREGDEEPLVLLQGLQLHDDVEVVVTDVAVRPVGDPASDLTGGRKSRSLLLHLFSFSLSFWA